MTEHVRQLFHAVCFQIWKIFTLSPYGHHSSVIFQSCVTFPFSAHPMSLTNLRGGFVKLMHIFRPTSVLYLGAN